MGLCVCKQGRRGHASDERYSNPLVNDMHMSSHMHVRTGWEDRASTIEPLHLVWENNFSYNRN